MLSNFTLCFIRAFRTLFKWQVSSAPKMIYVEDPTWGSNHCMLFKFFFFPFWVVWIGTNPSYVWIPKIIQSAEFRLLFPEPQYFSVTHVQEVFVQQWRRPFAELCLFLSLSLSIALFFLIFCPINSSQFDLFQLQILFPRLKITTRICLRVHSQADFWLLPNKSWDNHHSSYVFLLSGVTGLRSLWSNVWKELFYNVCHVFYLLKPRW